MTREHSTSEINLLKEAVKSLKLKWLFTDLDDTLIETDTVYKSNMAAYSAFIASKAGADPELVHKFMDSTLSSLRPKFSVNPELMIETARLTAENYRIDFGKQETQDELGMLMNIYGTTPQLFEGVNDTLGLLKDSGLNVLIITHCDQEWAKFKVMVHRLPADHILAVPSIETKNTQQWINAIDKVGADPKLILATGDSWTSDVSAALGAGIPAKNILRIKTAYSHANHGQIDNIRQINRFAEVPQVLLEIAQR